MTIDLCVHCSLGFVTPNIKSVRRCKEETPPSPMVVVFGKMSGRRLCVRLVNFIKEV
jgi:hypothetical protein